MYKIIHFFSYFKFKVSYFEATQILISYIFSIVLILFILDNKLKQMQVIGI